MKEFERQEKANIDLKNTNFADLDNVDGALTWGGNDVTISKVVSILPANPDPNITYLIPEVE